MDTKKDDGISLNNIAHDDELVIPRIARAIREGKLANEMTGERNCNVVNCMVTGQHRHDGDGPAKQA